MTERRKEERRSKNEFWKETIEWIDQSWRAKKGRKYPFMPADFRTVQHLLKFYTPAEVCALWECYLKASPFYGSKTGYLISGFWQERSILLESKDFKTLSKKHEEKLGLVSVKDVVVDVGLEPELFKL